MSMRRTIFDPEHEQFRDTVWQRKRLDDCLQMHGGHGYMADDDIGRIHGGGSEIMKAIIARTL